MSVGEYVKGENVMEESQGRKRLRGKLSERGIFMDRGECRNKERRRMREHEEY